MGEETFVNCTGGGPIRVHVEDGKITKVRPLVFDDTDASSWTIEVDGKKYSPPRKACVAPFTLTERARVYSDDRIMYPMKRVDFDPKGAPGSTGPGGRNAQNRGKSPYVRISWEEAFDLVSGEMKRIREKYGPEAIISRASSHHNWGNVGYRTGAWARFFNSSASRISWTTRTAGKAGTGGLRTLRLLLAPGQPRALRHARGQPKEHRTDHPLGQRLRYHPRHLRRERVGAVAALVPGQGHQVRSSSIRSATTPRPTWATNGSRTGPGTDSAMAMAIAYVWLTEGTYDKDYVASQTVGFDEFEAVHPW